MLTNLEKFEAIYSNKTNSDFKLTFLFKIFNQMLNLFNKEWIQKEFSQNKLVNIFIWTLNIRALYLCGWGGLEILHNIGEAFEGMRISNGNFTSNAQNHTVVAKSKRLNIFLTKSQHKNKRQYFNSNLLKAFYFLWISVSTGILYDHLSPWYNIIQDIQYFTEVTIIKTSLIVSARTLALASCLSAILFFILCLILFMCIPSLLFFLGGCYLFRLKHWLCLKDVTITCTVYCEYICILHGIRF